MTEPAFPSLGFIGAGKMATAMIHGVVRSKLSPPDRIAACDTSSQARRVLRHAIETMQRFALADLPLVCAAIRTESNLLRSWKSYLGKCLRRKMHEELDHRKKEQPLTGNEAVEDRGDEDNETWEP